MSVFISKTTSIVLATSMAVAMALLTGCGGGGGPSSSGGTTAPTTPTMPTPTPVTTLSGYVVKGPVRGGTVRLYSVASNGSKTLLSSVLTGSDGAFSFTTSPANGTVLLAEVGDGTYTDEMTVQSVSLNAPLRAATVWNGTALPLSISVFTEMAVRTLVNASVQNWSAANVNAANAAMATAFDVSNVLDFKPADLRVVTDTSTLRPDDFTLSLESGGFAGYTPRANVIAGTSGLVGGLDAYYQLIVNDPDDDRYFPAYLLGMTDFITASALPTGQKNVLRSSLLLGFNASITTANIYYPNGTASGNATAPMPNDVLQLVPAYGFSSNATAGSVFNKRGAMTAYQIAPGINSYQVAYSASVGEVYGDGDVGLGRWHGGVVYTAPRTGTTTDFGNQTSNLIWTTGGGWVYAVARPATALPTCGVRTLTLAGSTQATGAPGVTTAMPITGLTTDSTMTISYSTSPITPATITTDIGVTQTNGTVTRFQSISPISLGPTPFYAGQASTPTSLGLPPNMNLSLRAAGAGANEVAARIEMTLNGVPFSLAAAFKGTNRVNTSGCALN